MGFGRTCLLTLTAAIAASAFAEPLVLVKEGKPAAVIVIASKPTQQAASAAAELRQYLKRISGADVAVKREDQLAAPELASTLVLIGATEAGKQHGMKLDALPAEGFVIRTAGPLLLLAGRVDGTGKARQQGTQFAVDTFIEDYLRVGWLWPGDLGEALPHSPTISLDPIDRTESPAFPVRKIRDALGNLNPRKWGKGKQAIHMEEAKIEAMQQASAAWRSHMKLGSSLELNYGHAFTQWWDTYHLQHPDWFAMQLNGSRQWPTGMGGNERAKMCVSNPAMLDQWVANAKQAFANDPRLGSFSATPNDNAYNGHCMCDLCKAWDPPIDTPGLTKVQLTSVGKDGKRVTFNYPALTDRYVHFYNLAADRLAKEAPGKLVGGYAYGAWKTPPVREKVRENVLIGFVGFSAPSAESWDRDRQSWDAWSKAAHHLFLRPNLLHAGYGLPLLMPHRLGTTLRHCADTGMMAADFDSLIHHWAGEGLNYYVLAKLLWNPKADVDALVRDYCDKGFGPAAPQVRDYFAAVERLTEDKVFTTPQARKGDWVLEVLPAYSEPALADLQTKLDAAKQSAAGDPTVLARIEFLEKGLEYARLQTAAVHAIADHKDRSTIDAAVAARQNFYRGNLYSFAVNIPDITYREMGSPKVFGVKR